MIIDREIFQEYPFEGKFYTTMIDKTKPRDEWKEEEVVILETKCDIQGAQKEDGGVISNSYNVYFPFDIKEGIKVRKGHKFDGSMYGMTISNADVIDVVPNQLGGCAVYVKDNTNG